MPEEEVEVAPIDVRIEEHVDLEQKSDNRKPARHEDASYSFIDVKEISMFKGQQKSFLRDRARLGSMVKTFSPADATGVIQEDI